MSIGEYDTMLMTGAGTNLKQAMCLDGIDFTHTYSNNCVEIFDVLGIEAACVTIVKELHNVIKFKGS